MSVTACAYWMPRPGMGEIRDADVPEPGADGVLVTFHDSAVSRQTTHARGRAAAEGTGGRMRFTPPLVGRAIRAVYGPDLPGAPSWFETYGLVVIETLARVMPVLGTDVAGFRKALVKAAYGVRRLGDWTAIAQSLSNVPAGVAA